MGALLLWTVGCGRSAAPAADPNAASPPRVVAKVERLHASRPPYTAVLHVPRLVWAGHRQVVSGVDGQIDAWVHGQVAGFSKGVAKDLAGAHDLPKSLPQSRLTLTFQVAELSGGVASFRFLIEPYDRGAASPAQLPAGLTFDLKTGRRYRLGALFRPGSGYLGTLAGAGAAGLRSFHPAGAHCYLGRGGPPARAASFGAWWLSPKGLVLAFPAGMYTSAYCGPPAVTVPAGTLRALAAPGTPLAPRQGTP